MIDRVLSWVFAGISGVGSRLAVPKTPAGRALLIEQFRILTSQIPVLYGVLIVESVSISYVLPASLPAWFGTSMRC